MNSTKALHNLHLHAIRTCKSNKVVNNMMALVVALAHLTFLGCYIYTAT